MSRNVSTSEECCKLFQSEETNVGLCYSLTLGFDDRQVITTEFMGINIVFRIEEKNYQGNFDLLIFKIFYRTFLL